jgi:cytochrome P450
VPVPTATKAPGPRGSFLLGSIGEFTPDPPRFLWTCARDHGPVVRFRLGPSTVYLVSDPDLLEDVLVRSVARFRKDVDTRDVGSILGEGLLTSDGETWKRHRKLLAPPLQAQTIESYAREITATAEAYAAELADGQVRDLDQDLRQVTLKIVSRTLLGVEVLEEVQAIGAALEAAVESLGSIWNSWLRLFPRWFPVGPRLRLRREVRRLDELLYRIIDRRKAANPDRMDVLSILMRSDGAFTARELRDEGMTMLLAGHDTTALALTYALHLLAGRPDLADLPLDDASLDAVVRETLRLYPPAWAIGREPLEDIELGGFRIPRGSQVWLSPWVLHHDERWFPEPDAFRPERWRDGLADRLPRFAYFPFGGGPRTCIGNHFAMLEMRLVLRTLLRRARFERVPGHELKVYPFVTLRPVGGVKLRVRITSSATPSATNPSPVRSPIEPQPQRLSDPPPVPGTGVAEA